MGEGGGGGRKRPNERELHEREGGRGHIRGGQRPHESEGGRGHMRGWRGHMNGWTGHMKGRLHERREAGREGEPE
jgi:hypothetical protein